MSRLFELRIGEINMFEKCVCHCCGETVKKVEEYENGILLCPFCMTKIRMFDRLYRQRKDQTFWNEYSFFANLKEPNPQLISFLNSRYAVHIEMLRNGPRINYEPQVNSQPAQVGGSNTASESVNNERKTSSFAGDMASSFKNLAKPNPVTYNNQLFDSSEYDFDRECDKYLKIFKGSINIAFWLEIIASVIVGFFYIIEDGGTGLLIMIGGIIAAVAGKIVSTLLLHFLMNVNKIRKNTEEMLKQRKD